MDFRNNQKLDFYRSFKENIDTKLFNFENSVQESKIIFRLRSKCCKLRAHNHMKENSFCRFCIISLETVDNILLRCGKLDSPRHLLKERLGEILSPRVQLSLTNLLGNCNLSLEKQKLVLYEVIEFLRLITVEI